MDIKRTYVLGPCAAESREQVMETAKAICDLRSQIADFQFIFRAGVWKPRTRPDSFQGAGEAALGWLEEVKERFGIAVATEVATPEHVAAALKAEIDYLWIGARTAANPMAVQALAESLNNPSNRNHLKGILIKNPVNADADLWLGNIARLEKTGVKVIAVHRGCGHKPCWFMAHKVRLARPDIPMLLDPSHMSGDAAQVPELMSKIDELGLDGAMIEVHCHPCEALSDSKQQIRPQELSNLIHPNTPNRPNTELNWLRAEIDELDETLWDTLAARMEVSQRIGEWKKAHDVSPLQQARYEQIVEKLKEKGERFKEAGLSTDFILRIWDLIHEQSLRQQE